MTTPPLLSQSLDESENLLWISKNPSLFRPSSNFQRKGSFDSFVNIIKSSAIELAYQKENEEKKEGFRESNERLRVSNIFREEPLEFDRSPSMFLDKNDNIYRKGKAI